MDPRCAAIHPMRPPLPLHPPSPSPCVQCALSTVTNSKVIYTLRRSACNTFANLSNDFPNLLRLGVSFLSDVLHDLLRALLTLPPSESGLAEELCSICVAIAWHYDNCTDGLAGKRLSPVLFSECTAAIMLQHSSINTSASITLLARLCETGELGESGLLPWESLPHDFAYRILSRCIGSVISYSTLTVLLKYVFKRTEARMSSELLQVASSILPTPRDPNADRMFLTVTSHLSEADPEALLESDTLPVVLKTAFMSSVKNLREIASEIIVRICDEPKLVRKVCAAAVFEYIVESLRVSDPSNVQLPLLYYSATALSAIARKQTSEKWVYSLDVVLSVARHLGTHIQELEPAVCAALREAPAALFSTQLVEGVVSFTMQMLAHKKDVTDVIKGISSLLERLRPNVRSLHAILNIMEGAAHSKDQMTCVSVLATKVGRHFIRLSTQSENTSDELVRLGRRLSFATFETWISAHRKTLDTMNTFKATVSVSSVDVIACLMDMLATMLDKRFIVIGAYDVEDRRRIVSWCWQMLPPRVAFAYCIEADVESDILNSVRNYLRTISFEDLLEVPDLEKYVPVTEELFLAALAADSEERTWLTAHQLLRRGLELELLENLCQPELVFRALRERLNVFFRHSSAQGETEAGTVVRLLSQICAHYGLIFPKPELPETILVSTLTNSEFSFSCPSDCLTFLSIIRQGSRSAADVAAWEIFADYFRVAVSPTAAFSDTMERIVEDESCIQSALYAIAKASDPVAIAECLLCLMRERTRPNVTFMRAMEEIGALCTACQSLRDVESTLNRDEGCQHQLYGGQRPRGYQRNVNIGISFLVLLTEAASSSDFCSWRTLTRAVCDVFVLAAADKNRTTLTDTLLTAALNYLGALTAASTSGKASPLGYIWQSGVVGSALHMLNTLSEDNRTCDRLVSSICSFLVVILKVEDERFLPLRRDTVIPCLCEDIRWDRMLSSFPFAADINAAARIVSCCHLLKGILSAESGGHLKLSTGTFHKIMAALAVAACSVFDVIRDPALDALKTFLQMGTAAINWQTCLTVHQEISRDLLNHFYDNTMDTVSQAELSYLLEAIPQGHIDKYLMKHSPILSANRDSSCLGRKSNLGFYDQVMQSLVQRNHALCKQQC